MEPGKVTICPKSDVAPETTYDTLKPKEWPRER